MTNQFALLFDVIVGVVIEQWCQIAYISPYHIIYHHHHHYICCGCLHGNITCHFNRWHSRDACNKVGEGTAQFRHRKKGTTFQKVYEFWLPKVTKTGQRQLESQSWHLLETKCTDKLASSPQSKSIKRLNSANRTLIGSLLYTVQTSLLGLRSCSEIRGTFSGVCLLPGAILHTEKRQNKQKQRHSFHTLISRKAGHIIKVKLRWVRLIQESVTNFGGSTIPASIQATQPGHPSVGRCNDNWWWFWAPLGKKRRVLRSSMPRDRDCWHTGLSQLKAVAVNLSRPSGWHGLYASQICSNPHWLTAFIGDRHDELPCNRLCCLCGLFLFFLLRWHENTFTDSQIYREMEGWAFTHTKE